MYLSEEQYMVPEAHSRDPGCCDMDTARCWYELWKISHCQVFSLTFHIFHLMKLTKASGITEDSNQNKTWAEPDTGNFCWIRHKLDVIFQPVTVIPKTDTSNYLQCVRVSNLSYNLKRDKVVVSGCRWNRHCIYLCTKEVKEIKQSSFSSLHYYHKQ